MALLFLQWILRLLMVLIILQSVCVMIYYTPNTDSKAMIETLQQLRCARLRQKFSEIKPDSSIKLKNFTHELSDFLSCPHKPNKTECDTNSLQLQFCCNATGSFFLTKRNTAINQTISYETSRKHTYTIPAELHNMLPEDLPWSARALSRCAVVGSGGILKNSSCGREIDSSDFVIRFNLALINNSDVGLKTDLITINPSQLGYKNLEENPDPLVKRVSVYGNASLIIPAFAYTFCTAPSIKTLKVLRPIRTQQPVVFFSPDYLRELNRFWKKRGVKEARLSTGFMLISMALEVCEHVHVFGFWPFGTDLQDNPVPYHYYDRMKSSSSLHNMPSEFVHLLQLHSQGALTLHLQPCVSDN